MLKQVLDALDPQEGDVVCDCTLGGAGHSVALAKSLGFTGLSIGIDQDDMALAAASARFEQELPGVNHRFLKGNFGDLDKLLLDSHVAGVDGFLSDWEFLLRNSISLRGAFRTTRMLLLT